MKKAGLTGLIFATAILIGAVGTPRAQGQPIIIDTNHPPAPANVLSNLNAAGTFSAVAALGLGLLPYWDKTQTNSYAGGELEFEAAPTFKSATASGSTPYMSLGGQYFPARHFGLGGDAITFGNGAGSSTVDSAHAFAIGRADAGNVAGYALLGGGRQINAKRFDAEFGIGLEFQYSTGVRAFVDTRYCYLLGGRSKDGDHELLTRVGLAIHF